MRGADPPTDQDTAEHAPARRHRILRSPRERGLLADGYCDLRNVAVARLMLDNFPHVKAYWLMLTPKVAQTALSYGADDLDDTVTEERITHDAGTTAPMLLPNDELVHLIRSAGFEPVLRDTVYERLGPVA